MIVLAAPDKFRGTATAAEVCGAIAAAVDTVLPTARTIQRPMADGGEGTLEALGGPNRRTRVTGPGGTVVTAEWRLDDDRIAVIEAARANGLQLAGGAQSNDPVGATSRGVGELLSAAVVAGARHILLGVGGSATTDGGAPAVDALRPILRNGRLPVRVSVCCDVDTVFGDAARVFGPQKGAGPDQVERLTSRLHELRSAYRAEFGVDIGVLPGSGAAGGLAGGLAALGAELKPGFAAIADAVGFPQLLADADVVVTGEGKCDTTSFRGKVVGEVVRAAGGVGKPVLVVAGSVDAGVASEAPAGVRLIDLSAGYGRTRAVEDTRACIEDAVASWLARELFLQPVDAESFPGRNARLASKSNESPS